MKSPMDWSGWEESATPDGKLLWAVEKVVEARGRRPPGGVRSSNERTALWFLREALALCGYEFRSTVELV